MRNIDELIAEATASGGSERANYQLFITDLCDVLGLARPSMSQEVNARNDYVFERSLDYRHPDGSTTKLYVDCYKRGSFVLEAKQSARRVVEDERQATLFGSEANSRKLGHAKRGSRGWDRVMRAAYNQAVDYTRQLPVEHGYPPFVILVDVGHVIELYADFSGQGKNYAQFPDAQSFRLSMDDLRNPAIQERLKAVWADPHSLDPAKKSAEVTRDIAGRLARIAKNLEGKHDARDVAEFLMRCLFTMFAEDVGLLPKKLMVELLGKLVDNPSAFPPAMESLWRTMNTGGFEAHSMANLKHFNGGLFANPSALPLAPEDINELLIAAKQDWRDVEPAIFGTLLERALDSRERSKLGAHYTPRAYVERLVVPTIIEPLRADWDKVQATIETALQAGDPAAALARAKAFHHELCTIRVLDPACGTGNFLYVALEMLKKLEGEVLAAIDSLGEDQSRLMMEGETVNPRQFYGLELNPRAVPIADLVLWIGYLKWQLRTAGLNAISEPVLHAYGTIRQQDAVLEYDDREPVRDASGQLVSRWDGRTHIEHPITGELVPDQEARIQLFSYLNARPSQWPEAEFIVGNPPFISARELRAELGDGYADALGLAYPNIAKNVDFVVYFWVKALQNNGVVRASGLVATSRLRMPQNNAPFADALGRSFGRIVFAVPDHTWPEGKESAAVRICMVVVGSANDGLARLLITPDKDQTLSRSYTEQEYRTLSKIRQVSFVPPSLNLDADPDKLVTLIANGALGSAGVKPYSQGFFVRPGSAEAAVVRPFANGAIVGQRRPLQHILDVNHLSEAQLRTNYPKAYQRILNAVRPKRETERNPRLRLNWWKYEANREELRGALKGLPFYFATLENSPRRYFVSMRADILPDQKLRVVASSDWNVLAVLSSRVHERWSVALGGRAGKANTPVYNSRCFDLFPFPSGSNYEVLAPRLAELGQRLDAFRQERLHQHSFLNLTTLYNMLERVRLLEWKAGVGRHSDEAVQIAALTPTERAVYDAGHIGVLKEIHDDIDRVILAAYGWSDLSANLVGLPGATSSGAFKTETQSEAEGELMNRLVSLNQKRAAEESIGIVRWLRPEFQISLLGHKVARSDGLQIEADLSTLPKNDKPKWPASDTEQINVLVDLLRRASAPVPPESLAASFDGRMTPKRRDRIASLLDTLTTIGLARSGQSEGQTRYFIPR